MMGINLSKVCPSYNPVLFEEYWADFMTTAENNCTITLKDLLEDRAYRDESLRNRTNELEMNYHDSLNEYLKGYNEKCLESLLTADLLKRDVLETNAKIWKLFISACSGAKMATLGVSVQKVTDAAFCEVDIPRAQLILKNETVCEEAAGILKYLGCCHEYVRSGTSYHTMSDLAKRTLEYIRDYSSRAGDVDGARQLYELVWFYISAIQVQGLQKKMSTLLYEQICEAVPAVSRVLQNFNDTDLKTSLESRLLATIEASKVKKPSKPTLATRRNSKATASGSRRPSATLQNKSNSTSSAPLTTTSHKMNYEGFPKLRNLASMLAPHFSRRFVPVLLFVLLIAFKKTSKIAELSNKLLSILPVLRRRLMSIISIILSF